MFDGAAAYTCVVKSTVNWSHCTSEAGKKRTATVAEVVFADVGAAVGAIDAGTVHSPRTTAVGALPMCAEMMASSHSSAKDI